MLQSCMEHHIFLQSTNVMNSWTTEKIKFHVQRQRLEHLHCLYGMEDGPCGGDGKREGE
jgi:hypothetical protein